LTLQGQDPRVLHIRIVRTGYQFAVLKDGRRVPREIAGVAAGPDAWMRSIEFKCDTCGILKTARHFAESDVPGDCQICAEEFWCSVCGGHPDDCGTDCETVNAFWEEHGPEAQGLEPRR
jgi:hypothetical protein